MFWVYFCHCPFCHPQCIQVYLIYFFLNLFISSLRIIVLQHHLVSTICQHESGTAIYMVSSSKTSLPTPSQFHPSVVTEQHFELPAAHSKFTMIIYFAYGNVYVSILHSPFVSFSLFTTVSINLFSMSASPLLPCK